VGTVALKVDWPAASAGVETATIPAATRCVQVAARNAAGWSSTVAVARPADSLSTTVTLEGVPAGAVHLHIGAYSNFTSGAGGKTVASGNLLAWAVRDVQIPEGEAVDVYYTFTSEPASIEVTSAGAADSLGVGGELQLSAAALDGDGNALAVPGFSWTSKNEGLATVDGAGKVTGIAPGTVDITAAAGTQTGKLRLTVTP